MMVPSSINNEYTVLPVQLPPSHNGAIASSTHYIYLRPHEPKVPTPNSDRSLFAVNLPIDATTAHIRALFSNVSGRISQVEDVQFYDEERERSQIEVQDRDSELAAAAVTTAKGTSNGKKRKHEGDAPEKVMAALERLPTTWDREIHRSGATAVIMFVDRSSMEAAIKGIVKLWREKEKEIAKKRKIKKKSGEKDKDEVTDEEVQVQVQLATWGEGISEEKERGIPSLGLQRYLNHHKLCFPSPTALQTSVDTYMSAFSQLENQRLQALAKRQGVPDEEGFITVYRGGRSGGVKAEIAEELLAKKREEEERAKKQNIGFYRFQVREQRKEAARRLLEKFELDKKRVAERKNMRKFKPL